MPSYFDCGDLARIMEFGYNVLYCVTMRVCQSCYFDILVDFVKDAMGCWWWWFGVLVVWIFQHKPSRWVAGGGMACWWCGFSNTKASRWVVVGSGLAFWWCGFSNTTQVDGLLVVLV